MRNSCSTLTALLDKFAPVKKRCITERPDTAWFTPEVRRAKKVRRQAERRWRKSRLEVDRQIYRHTRSQCSAIIVKARSRDDDDQIAASTLSAYFEDKIKTIMDSFSDSVATLELDLEVGKKAVCLLCSESVAVFKEYNSSRHDATTHAGCGIDPVIWPAKDLISPYPARRPEKLPTPGLLDKFQSAYRPKHSCETALLRLMNDLLCSADAGKVSLVVLLDLSAAFDVIDHSTLLTRLQMEVGIGGSALQWFHSYLSDRTQR
ncbi:hypothetical protein C0Q70_20092 [Pomacea canaliculata]|uniref:Uncharacterized protein n=1 Tax=Pomacea canaliculata TaxID=400727 RepID=A0A2T7NEP8_POMCA|nr:hypothetical protein C0Q70_20092 [Pomacea canaliculata]